MARLSKNELLDLASHLVRLHEKRTGRKAENVVVSRLQAYKTGGKNHYVIEVEVDGTLYTLQIRCKEHRDYCAASLFIDGLWASECADYCTDEIGPMLDEILNKYVTNIEGGKFGRGESK